ncbi:hypothetical protein AXG93_1333s1060 [Marchantia polymorpha subsp. ruderalis]|uniref:Uncharacterized protein n=1 Tax=Marchantia polymorpha subsp. ruderalis TaxID=1480154 RepID=A0A176WQ18_MARPO|nr:hypothetical protein AXG93_1333s1060 [Marchantia polymorpha subsp. ruderalis]
MLLGLYEEDGKTGIKGRKIVSRVEDFTSFRTSLEEDDGSESESLHGTDAQGHVSRISCSLLPTQISVQVCEREAGTHGSEGGVVRGAWVGGGGDAGGAAAASTPVVAQGSSPSSSSSRARGGSGSRLLIESLADLVLADDRTLACHRARCPTDAAPRSPLPPDLYT